MITYLNGVDQDELGSLFKHSGKLKKALRKSRRPFVKVAATPTRVAFLGLVRINALHLATKLDHLLQLDPTKLQNLWLKFGGDFDKLKEEIEKGKNRKHIFKKRHLSGLSKEDAEIGVDVEAAIAAAMPIVLALFPMFKKLGIHTEATPEEAATHEEAIKEGQETFLKENPPVTETSATETGKEAGEETTPFYKDPKKMSLTIGAAALLTFGIYKLAKNSNQ